MSKTKDIKSETKSIEKSPVIFKKMKRNGFTHVPFI